MILSLETFFSSAERKSGGHRLKGNHGLIIIVISNKVRGNFAFSIMLDSATTVVDAVLSYVCFFFFLSPSLYSSTTLYKKKFSFPTSGTAG